VESKRSSDGRRSITAGAACQDRNQLGTAAAALKGLVLEEAAGWVIGGVILRDIDLAYGTKIIRLPSFPVPKSGNNKKPLPRGNGSVFMHLMFRG